MEGSGNASPRLGKYELRGELGRGAMGVVYRAYDTVLRRDVALKTMSTPDSDKAQTVRFLREARTAGALHHPNIVTIHELGHDTGQYYIAMELLEGQTLRQAMAAGQLPPIHRRLEVVARLSDGLDYAHRAGIVHRDIKPANIFLLKNGTVKILDFGIAKIAASDTTRTGLLIGSIEYMSPEQVRAVKNLDGRSDIFSAGVILYELLFRRRPFAAEDLGAALNRILHQQPPGYSLFDRVLPDELAAVLKRSLDKRREARYTRAGEVATELDAVAETLKGRVGTEVEERIDEVIASGVLEQPDRESSVPVVSPDAETRDDPDVSSGPAVGKAAKPSLARWRNKILAAAAVVVALVAIVILGNLQKGKAPEQSALNTLPPRTSEPSANQPVPDPVVEPSQVAAAPEKPAAGVTEVAPSARKVPARAKPVPPPRPGTLDVLVMPWANVAWIESLDTGKRIPSDASTPVRLELPAGRYRLRLVNPYVGKPFDLEAGVRAGKVEEIRYTLPGFDARGLAREILAREGVGGKSK